MVNLRQTERTLQKLKLVSRQDQSVEAAQETPLWRCQLWTRQFSIQAFDIHGYERALQCEVLIPMQTEPKVYCVCMLIESPSLSASPVQQRVGGSETDVSARTRSQVPLRIFSNRSC